MEFPYEFVKNKVIEEGYLGEIQWCDGIEQPVTKTTFFREYVWVVLNSGISVKAGRKIFEDFCNHDKKEFNFDAIKHPSKNKAVKEVFNRLDFYYNHYLTSKNKLKFLKSLPHIGDVTKYHLARNLGLDYAKPDRHLIRISNLFNITPQKLCEDISRESGDKIGTVDLVIWRFATLFQDYLKIIEKEVDRK